MIQTSTQSPEFLGGRFVRTLQIEQVRFRRRLESNLRHVLQNSRMQSANCGVDLHGTPPILRRPRRTVELGYWQRFGLRVSAFQIRGAGLSGAAQRIVYSAHLLPSSYRNSSSTSNCSWQWYPRSRRWTSLARTGGVCGAPTAHSP